MTKTTNNPWAGLASYEDPAKSDRKLKFCGRDNDIYDVARLIDDNLLLVLYGKSGIGKTSLLNAGVFPKLRLEQYLPVSIRLGILEADASYQEAVISAIECAIKEAQGCISVFNVVEEQTDNQLPDRLWNYFAKHRFANAEGQPLFPVVVLDQFEEVLRNAGPEHVDKARTLLNQLQYLIDESHALNDCVVDGQEYFYDFNFRFVISIREDELYLLEDNIDDLSLGMFRNCRYRLRSLSERGASEAILSPGMDCIAEEQKTAIVERIIGLSKRPQSNDIDTLLLSLVCAGTYDKKSGEKITLADLAVWKSNPMEVYYHDAVEGLPADQVRYIQRHLIREDGSRRRVDAAEVKAALGEASYRLLTQGANRLFSLSDKGQVELLHDQLGMAVYEERKNVEEKERKKKQRQKRIRNICILALIVVLGVFITQTLRYKQVRWKMLENQARFISEKALSISDEDSYLASLLAIEVLPTQLNNPDKPHTIEAEIALRNSYYNNSAILKGHTDRINNITYSSDGKLIASASNDKTARIWNASNGALLQILHGHNTSVNSVQFCPNDQLIATASNDHTIKIWDVETGTLLKTLNGHNDNVNYAAFNNDGTLIVSASDDNTIRIWDTETGTVLRAIEQSGRINSAIFSPNGQLIASTSDNNQIKLWDSSLGTLVNTLYGHSSPIQYLEFSPNGRFITTVSGNNIDLWDLLSNDCIMALKKDKRDSSFGDNQSNHNYYVSSSFSPDSKFLITASDDYEITYMDIETGLTESTMKSNGFYVNYVAFDPNSKATASAHENNIFLMGEKKNLKKILFGHECGSNYATFSTNDNLISSAGEDNLIRIWETQSGHCLDSLYGHFGGVSSVLFTLDNKRLVSSGDGSARIWNIDAKQCQNVLLNHGDGVTFAALSSNDNLIATSSLDNTITLWDFASGKRIMSLEGHQKGVTSVAFSANDSYLASTSLDNTIRIWDVESGDNVRTITGNASWSYSVFHPKKPLLAAASGNTIYIWNLSTGICENKLEGHTDIIHSVAYCPNGDYIVSASSDNTIRIWSGDTGKCIQELKGHTSHVTSASFSHDLKYIVSSSWDGTIRIWNFSPLQELIYQTRERFKDRPLTPEERRMYYLE